MRAFPKRWLRLVATGAFFALMFGYAGASITLNLTRGKLTIPLVRGWLVTPREDRLIVSYVSADSPVSQLQVGDEILALDGQSLLSLGQMYNSLKDVKGGSSCVLTVMRGGHELSITIRSLPASPVVVAQFLISVFTTAMFLFSGFALFLLKPCDRTALSLALFFGTIVIAPLPFFNPATWLLTLMVAGSIVSAFSAPLFLRFTLNFPRRSQLLRRFPRLEWYSLLPALLVNAPLSGVVVFNALRAPGRLAVAPFPLLNRISTIIFLLYLMGGLLSFAGGYRSLSSKDKRSVRVILVATLVAAAPLIGIQALTLVLNGPPNPIASGPMNRLGASLTQLGWLSVVRLATAWILPPAWAYAILRHQVIPIRLMIRRSVQYLLAKSALRILIALPLIGLIFEIISHRNRTLTELLFRNSIYFYLLLIIAVVVILVFHGRLRVWIDRKFFREAYNQERILLQLIEKVKRCDSIGEMSKCVAEQIDQAFHPECVCLFYREDHTRDLSLSHTSSELREGMRIPEEFELLRFMERTDRAQDFYLIKETALPPKEIDWLRQLGTQLIVPITGTGKRLDGLMLLGGKKSEVPYTKGDRELLQSLANQIAIVYENVRLKERVDRERRLRNEVLARIEDREINLLKECPRCATCYDSSAQLCSLDQSELTLSLPVERTIENRYRLERVIGKGGMGAVYQAEDRRLNRKVAVKILIGKLFGDNDALRRFEREAQMLARLNHPHIITTFDYGVLETEGAYLVMELLEGETLGQLIRRETILAPAVAAELFDQLLDALEAAHAARIIHRDLKPENIFLSYNNFGQRQIKILDFGLAKLMHVQVESNPDWGFSMTTPGMILGTLGYMSPEQLTGAAMDERSDLFSVGVIAVEVLTGHRPFSGRTTHELLTAMLSQSSSLIENLTKDSALDRVLRQCLTKDPAARFSSASEVRHELIPAIKRYSAIDYARPVQLEARTMLVRIPRTLSDSGNQLTTTLAR